MECSVERKRPNRPTLRRLLLLIYRRPEAGLGFRRASRIRRPLFSRAISYCPFRPAHAADESRAHQFRGRSASRRQISLDIIEDKWNIFSQAGVQLAEQWTLCGQPGGCAGQPTFAPCSLYSAPLFSGTSSRARFEVKEWRLATDHSSRLSRARLWEPFRLCSRTIR